MRRIFATLALAAAATALAPFGASSAPIQPAGISVVPPVEAVQYNRGFYRQGGNGYYNGYRGYSYYRPGYRRYGEWWFPGAAFAAGALVGGAMAAQPEPGYPAYAEPSMGGDAHVQWCMQTYRSYRPADDTFQPRNGPRQPCVSPY